MVLSVVVDGFRGEEMSIDLCDTEEQLKNITVLRLKKEIIERIHCESAENLCLIFEGKLLYKDSNSLSEYGIQHKSTILAVLRVPGGRHEVEEAVGLDDKEGSMEKLWGNFKL